MKPVSSTWQPSVFLFVLAIQLSICLGSTQVNAQQQRPASGLEKLRILQNRETWFYQQRAFPHRMIPPRARLNALLALERMLTYEAAQPSISSSVPWHQIGPEPAGFWNSSANGGSSGRVTSTMTT